MRECTYERMGNINNFQLNNTEYPFECEQCPFVKDKTKSGSEAWTGCIYNTTTNGRFVDYQNKAWM